MQRRTLLRGLVYTALGGLISLAKIPFIPADLPSPNPALANSLTPAALLAMRQAVLDWAIPYEEGYIPMDEAMYQAICRSQRQYFVEDTKYATA